MIRKGIAWTFGIILGSVLAYLAWSSLMTPEFLMGETKTVTGKVIEVFPSKEVKSFKRKIKYVYPAGGKYYVDFKKLGTHDEKQAIGNEVKVLYSVDNPERNKVERLITRDVRFRKVKYYSSKDDGYIEMQLNNGVFTYQEFVDQGKIINDFVGQYEIENDSLKLKQYTFENEDVENHAPTLFVFDKKHRNQIIDTKTKRIFKRI